MRSRRAARSTSRSRKMGLVVRQQFAQALQEMKADAAILDSDDDGLDAFGPADAKHLRAARADMGR